jgi:hypothetical protein
MNDNYLWDRTGEPDKEIEELERVLGTLRHAPRPWVLPSPSSSTSKTRIPRLRLFVPRAIAAAVGMVIFGLGIWFVTNNSTPSINSAEPANAVATFPAAPGKSSSEVDSSQVASALPGKNAGGALSQRNPDSSARRRATRHRREFSTVDENAVVNAKRQLMLALRVASMKLNLAQKRAQGLQPTSPYRNQHKVG